jgi:two-component system OmpR family response regulator
VNNANRILLIDDDEMVTDLFATILLKAGYEVLTVNDAEDAVSTAVEFQPDLIVLDGSFPGVDGTEILTGLRQREETAFTRVAFFSGKCIPLEQFDQLTWFLAKPMGLQAFLAAVRYVLTCPVRKPPAERLTA